MGHSLEDLRRAIFVCLHEGKQEEAFDVCCIALKDERAGHDIKLCFTAVACSKRILSFNPVIKNAVQVCLDDNGIEHQKFSILWVDLVLSDPDFVSAVTEALNLQELNMEYWASHEDRLLGRFFLTGLRRFIVTDDKIETFLTKLRRFILLHLWPLGILKTKHMDLLCAMAEQNFNNEYSYFLEENEQAALEALPGDNALAVAILASYKSLQGKNDVLKLSAIKSYKNLVNLQVVEPKKEEDLKAIIPVLGSIQNDVSEKVQAQYEQNPYPRWVSLDEPLEHVMSKNRGKVLIAGCGTGRFTIQIGLAFPAMEIKAVDISRSSIAYAQRKAEQYEVGNIDFYQCDILNLNLLDQTFDFINCSGVLHHMENPVAGWKKLIERLAPGGAMLIGLYSTKARRVIHELRDYVAQKGYASDMSDLRNFRRHILSLPNNHPHRVVTNFKDFYTSSDVRDLIFHVQETTYTIPELKAILDLLNLNFCFFKMPNHKLMMYFKERFGESANTANLDLWDQLENERPHIFGEMYNFLCHRKNEKIGPSMQAILDMGVIGR